MNWKITNITHEVITEQQMEQELAEVRNLDITDTIPVLPWEPSPLSTPQILCDDELDDWEKKCAPTFKPEPETCGLCGVNPAQPWGTCQECYDDCKPIIESLCWQETGRDPK